MAAGFSPAQHINPLYLLGRSIIIPILHRYAKAEGLKRLCEYYGMDLSQTVAFGDSMNDFEIVSRAGIGIAMGNSVEELKAAADYVTDPIDRDGVWNACRHFGWI